MKQEFKAHPLMILSLIKPFLFVLILPVLKGAVQYLIYRRITGVFTLEAAALIVMLLAAFLRFRSFSIVCGKNGVKISEGVFLKKTSYRRLKAVLGSNGAKSAGRGFRRRYLLR